MKSWRIHRSLTSILLAAGLGAVAAGAAADPGSRAGLWTEGRVYDATAVLASVQSQDPTLEPQGLGETKPKNGKLAMLYSLILPGLGEYYLGSKGRATGFFVVEGALWTTYFVSQGDGNHRQTQYKEFAQIHAGVDPRDDSDYYRTIGNYIGADGPFSANEQVRREARLIYPTDREAQEEYFNENAYTGDDAWLWDSTSDLARYQSMRQSSLDSYHTADLTLGLLLANRLLSVLDVGILSAKMNKNLENETTLSWSLDADARGPGANVVLSRAF